MANSPNNPIRNAVQFKPGNPGKPMGGEKGIAAKARLHTGRAIEVLVEGLEDFDSKVRIMASKELLDRGYGKPIMMTADVTNRIEDMDDESLDAAITALKQTIGIAEEGRGGTLPPRKH